MTVGGTTPTTVVWTSKHVDAWLVKTGEVLRTADGKPVDVVEFRHRPDEGILTPWARHFRNHYCSDDMLEALVSGTGLSREEYLTEFIFPHRSAAPGPSVRAGDFAEILVADYLEYVLRFWVPRFRYDNKAVRSESTKGTDILGFRIVGKGTSSRDTLAMFEAKASLSGHRRRERLQDAVDDSAKDWLVRKGETLNALKRRFLQRGETASALTVERFQDEADRPYRALSGAAAVFATEVFEPVTVTGTDAATHPNAHNLVLLVIKGDELMALVHDLYERAAREA